MKRILVCNITNGYYFYYKKLILKKDKKLSPGYDGQSFGSFAGFRWQWGGIIIVAGFLHHTAGKVC